MPFVDLTETTWRRHCSRILIIGEPNTWKTSSVVTFGTKEAPVHLLSYPGEKGIGSVPVNDSRVKSYFWEEIPGKLPLAPDKVLAEIETTTQECLAGKRGPIGAFFGDGIHKLYDVHYEAACLSIKDAGGDPYGKGWGRPYKLARDSFMRYIGDVTSSQVPIVVFTCWEGASKDDPQNIDEKAPQHRYADLPGMLAPRSTGEFGVVVRAKITLGDGKTPAVGIWRTRRDNVVWGVGIKAPVEIAKRVPPEIPQDWPTLAQYLFGNVTST